MCFSPCLAEPPGYSGTSSWGWFLRSTRLRSPTLRSMQVVLGALSSPLLPGLHPGAPLASRPCPSCTPPPGTPFPRIPQPSPHSLRASLLKLDCPRALPTPVQKSTPWAHAPPARRFSSPSRFTLTFCNPACHPLDDTRSFRCNISAIRTCLTIDRMS